MIKYSESHAQFKQSFNRLIHPGMERVFGAKTQAPIIILRLRNMTAIDATGPRALENLADVIHGSGRALFFAERGSSPPG